MKSFSRASDVREDLREMDWQDKLVVFGSTVAALFLLCYLTWGPTC